MEKFKVNGAVARALIKELARQGTIKRVDSTSAKFDLFTGTQAKSALEKAAEDAAAAALKKK
jgi:ribosomal protein S25